MLKAQAWYDEAKKSLAKCKEELDYDSDNPSYVMMKNNAKHTFRDMLDKELALGPGEEEVTYDKKEGKKKKVGRQERVGNVPFKKYGKAFKAADFKDVLKNHKNKLPKQCEWVPDRPGNVPKGKCQARRYKDKDDELLIRVVEEVPAQKYQVYSCDADWKVEALKQKRLKEKEDTTTSDEDDDEKKKNDGDGGGASQDQVDAPAEDVAQAPTPAPEPPLLGRGASRRRTPAGEAAAHRLESP